MSCCARRSATGTTVRGMVTGPDTDERTALLHFLAANRRAALQIVEGMSEADARRSVVPSGWTPFDLLVHLGGVERHWFLRVLAGDTNDPPAHPGEVSTLAEAVVSYRAECERSDPSSPGSPSATR